MPEGVSVDLKANRTGSEGRLALDGVFVAQPPQIAKKPLQR